MVSTPTRASLRPSVSRGQPGEKQTQMQMQMQMPAQMPACPAVSSLASAPCRSMERLPVEIFDLITPYLERADVQSLRLVNRAFESKVSAQYFRNVVVPFKAGLYAHHGRPHGGSVKPDPLGDGIRVFRSFGPHILRFALSLEIDPQILAHPPIKMAQKAVPSFWGIYRWPHEDYHRYRDIADLERTADDTGHMKEALACLEKVINLGLCCDAGLGYLPGPPIRGRAAAAPHPVFSTRDRCPDSAQSDAAAVPLVAVTQAADTPPDAASPAQDTLDAVKRLVLLKMLFDAGYVGHQQTRNALLLMLQTEGTTMETIDLGHGMAAVRKQDEALAGLLNDPDPYATRSLNPADLTMAQKEMLLELEWAHRAMIQSFVIALVDNAALGCFANVTTLTFARIPSSHVQLLCRDDLWVAIPSLRNVTMGVIADWRSVTASGPGHVNDEPVSPIQAVPHAFRLLNDHIGKQPGIESIHFEWLCGGELASGVGYRNGFVLPAPFFENPELMMTPTGLKDHVDELLCLPYACHLSLKNCWTPPHVLLQTVRQMALASLEHLKLESVSLSGPPTMLWQPSIAPLMRRVTVADQVPGHAQLDGLPGGAMPGGTGPFTFAQPQPADENQPLSPALNAETGTGRSDLMSWPGIIDHFLPNLKAQHHESAKSTNGQATGQYFETWSTFMPRAAQLALEQGCYWLRSMSFRSCGYAALDLPYIRTRTVAPSNMSLLPLRPWISDTTFPGSQMQRCDDRRMALIIPFIHPGEVAKLKSTFGMIMGWDGIYDMQTIGDAIADDIYQPGRGRFSGIVELACEW